VNSISLFKYILCYQNWSGLSATSCLIVAPSDKVNPAYFPFTLQRRSNIKFGPSSRIDVWKSADDSWAEYFPFWTKMPARITVSLRAANACSQSNTTNYKKFGDAKMTPALTRQRLKETFQRCQELNSQIRLLADEELKKTHKDVLQKGKLYPIWGPLLRDSGFHGRQVSTSWPLRSKVFNSSKSYRGTILTRDVTSLNHDGSFDKWEGFRD